MSKEVSTLTSQKIASSCPELHERLTAKISTQDLIKIVEQASTISDRLGQGFASKKLAKEQKIIDSRLEKWCQVVAKGDHQKFTKRLKWDGLNRNKVASVLGDVNLINQDSLPSWADTLQKAMELAGRISQTIFQEGKYQEYSYLDCEKPIPFEEIYLAFVEVAQQKLEKKVASSLVHINQNAYIQLQSDLLRQLNNLFNKTLNLEFSLFRAYHGSQLFHVINKLQQNPSTRLYEQFVENLLADGLLAFFQEYSVLARLAAIATDFWIDTSVEFLQRLDSDWDRISKTFASGEKLGKVVDIQTGLSDLHNGGHSVIIIEFSSDFKLVYKPKKLNLEQAYFEFVTWINKQKSLLPLKTLKILNSSDYGWIEFVKPLPCQDQKAVARYYQRAGMISCLIYALRGTDCHQENLIASGEQPVLIDLETLLHHRPWSQSNDAEAVEIAQNKIYGSVLASALLPGIDIVINYKDAEGRMLDFSGLGNDSPEVSLRSLKWQNINTDSMTLSEVEVKAPLNQNLPFGENLDASISNHSEELITGFKQMYVFLQKRQEVLLAADSPLIRFNCQKVRLVLLNTYVYVSVLQNTLDPKYLRDGVDRSIELDIFSKRFLSSEEKPDNWEMLAAEKQALEQLDIPYITSYSDRNAVTINSEVTIDGLFDSSSYDDVTTRIKELSDDNLAEQISIIKSSCYSSSSNCNRDRIAKLNSNVNLEDIASISREKILHQGIKIGDKLAQEAIRGHNDSVAWLGMVDSSRKQKFQLRPLGYSLYDGHGGVAIFLAALAKVTGNKKYAELALGSLYSLRQLIASQDIEVQKQLAENMDMRGGAIGLASNVYTFVRIAEFLDEPELLEEAQQLAAWMQIEEAIAQPQLGIFNGVAGTILSLLSLYKATKCSEILEQATVLGKYLLKQRQQIDNNTQIWLDSDGQPLVGFAEGISGISYALLSLYDANQETVFLTTAIEAIAYEQNYLAAKDGCPEENTTSSLPSWCDGLPGIALGYLGSLKTLNMIGMCQELQSTLEGIERSPMASLDNICGGNFTEIEVLLLAAKELNNPEYLEIAEQKINRVICRRDRLGAFQFLPALPPEIHVPSFGIGTAGIGYGLLRYLYPEILPSILLWQ